MSSQPPLFVDPTTRTLRFQQRPAPVLPEHRTLFKITQILLVLKVASRGGKSSLPRLQLFNWAFKDASRMKQLTAAAQTGRLNIMAWGFDPTLIYALRFAAADGLIDRTSGSHAITPLGETLLNHALRDPTLLASERIVLEHVGKKITETMVDAVAKGWEG
jgi:hypothetical protein